MYDNGMMCADSGIVAKWIHKMDEM